MLLDVNISEKSFNNKSLIKDVKFSINENEIIGIIGRNGVGKSTILSILTGKDSDYTGNIIKKKNLIMASSIQEYHSVKNKTVFNFILDDLPNYANLKYKIEHLPEVMGDNLRLINEYTEALNKFHQNNFHFIEDKIIAELKDFGLGNFQNKKIKELSGGQKRLVDVIKILHSSADLALLDEPTNFMDYQSKNIFLNWLKKSSGAKLIITHDRDVLMNVDKIIEIKDQKSYIFNGDYEHYLKINTERTSGNIDDYQKKQAEKNNLADKLKNFQRMKEKARDPSTIKRFKRLENNAREKIAILDKTEKPSFWIDTESLNSLKNNQLANYDKFKAKNIKINTQYSNKDKSKRNFITINSLTAGYGELEDALESKNNAKILFENLNFTVNTHSKIELFGLNGAGKTTLIKIILHSIFTDYPINSQIYDGYIKADRDIRVGFYSQEVSEDMFELELKEAVENIYKSQNLSITESKIRQLLAQYLFLEEDLATKVKDLSGGQKARLQLIKMLSTDPQLLILDEPTSHLDLPSIEELEKALLSFNGAIIYVSHDNIFRKKIGGEKIEIKY